MIGLLNSQDSENKQLQTLNKTQVTVDIQQLDTEGQGEIRYLKEQYGWQKLSSILKADCPYENTLITNNSILFQEDKYSLSISLTQTSSDPPMSTKNFSFIINLMLFSENGSCSFSKQLNKNSKEIPLGFPFPQFFEHMKKKQNVKILMLNPPSLEIKHKAKLGTKQLIASRKISFDKFSNYYPTNEWLNHQKKKNEWAARKRNELIKQFREKMEEAYLKEINKLKNAYN